ncbi:hypothetical protein M434DRAFT_32048 [Hypoxylon sp. CO27-5]|nr:hypothetical protein M434DRAFT_32048 [Hypoxylon sp. CO27-5]
MGGPLRANLSIPGPSFVQFLVKTFIRIANFPNLRRLFIEARSDDEEREVSRRAFYNAVLFMGSVAVFSLVAQKMNASK